MLTSWPWMVPLCSGGKASNDAVLTQKMQFGGVGSCLSHLSIPPPSHPLHAAVLLFFSCPFVFPIRTFHTHFHAPTLSTPAHNHPTHVMTAVAPRSGGGGAAGSHNRGGRDGQYGGNGGGIVFIQAGGAITISGKVRATGSVGGNGYRASDQPMGGGGGGAGGSVLLKARDGVVVSGGQLEVAGASGGAMMNWGGCNPGGQGGGGGAGRFQTLSF